MIGKYDAAQPAWPAFGPPVRAAVASFAAQFPRRTLGEWQAGLVVGGGHVAVDRFSASALVRRTAIAGVPTVLICIATSPLGGAGVFALWSPT